MKSEFKTYLVSIGIGEPFAKKVEEAYQFYSEILKNMDDEIKDLFITDYIQQDGSRQHVNLWFFSKKYFMEAKMFINKDDFDFMPISSGLAYLRIEKQNYDFKQATNESRMTVEYQARGMMNGTLIASRNNCDKLREIIIKYFAPITN
ncbi:MAG: hypothetical protein ACYDHX_14185 [Methanothrix sp.]